MSCFDRSRNSTPVGVQETNHRLRYLVASSQDHPTAVLKATMRSRSKNRTRPHPGSPGYLSQPYSASRPSSSRLFRLIRWSRVQAELGIRASENKRSRSSHTTSNSALAKADLLRSWHGPPRSPAKQASRYLPKRRSGRSRPLRVSDETKPKNAVLVRQGEVGGLPHRMPAVLRIRAFLLRSRAIQLVGMFKSLLGGIVATLDYDSAPVPLSEVRVTSPLVVQELLTSTAAEMEPALLFHLKRIRNHEPPRTSSGMEMALA
jgi:hypothetical protein